MKIMFLYGLVLFLMNYSLYTMQEHCLFDTTYNRFIDSIDEFLSNKINYDQCADYAHAFKKYNHQPDYGNKVSFIKKYVNGLPESYGKSIQLKKLEMWLNKVAAVCAVSTTLLMVAVEYLDPNTVPKDALSAGTVVAIFPGYGYFTQRQEINGIYASLKKYQNSKDQIDNLIQDLEGRKVSSDI